MSERALYGSEPKYSRVSKVAATLVLSLGLSGCVQGHESDGAQSPTSSPAETATSQPLPVASPRETTENPEPILELEPSPTPPVESSPEPTLPVDPTEPVPELPEQPPRSTGEVVDCMVARCIALTFDDGPGPHTERLLGYLDEYEAKATFFVVGSRVESNEELTAEIHQQGHQVAGHSWNHDDLTTFSSEEIVRDTRRTNEVITEAIGKEPEVMRPPYGATNERVTTAVDMPQILWSVDTEDWRYRDSDYVAEYVQEHAERGDIILMHDIHESSVEAVPEILETLTEDGYELVTVDTLLGEDLPNGRYNEQKN